MDRRFHEVKMMCDKNRQHRYADTVKFYKKIIDDDPYNAWAFYNLGVAYSKMGCYTEAIEFLRQAIKVVPIFPDVYRCMSGIYGKLGSTKEQNKTLKMAETLEEIARRQAEAKKKDINMTFIRGIDCD